MKQQTRQRCCHLMYSYRTRILLSHIFPKKFQTCHQHSTIHPQFQSQTQPQLSTQYAFSRVYHKNNDNNNMNINVDNNCHCHHDANKHTSQKYSDSSCRGSGFINFRKEPTSMTVPSTIHSFDDNISHGIKKSTTTTRMYHYHHQEKNKDSKKNNEDSVREYWEAVKTFMKSPSLQGIITSSTSSRMQLNHKQEHHEISGRQHIEALPPIIRQILLKQHQQDKIVLPDLIARQLCEEYKRLDSGAKSKFFELMARDFGTDVHEVNACIEKYNKSSEKDRLSHIQQLRTTLVPLYERFLDHIIKQPNGMKFVVDMRSDLLDILKKLSKEKQSNFSLEELNNNLQQFLTSWFSSAYLNLSQVTWDHTPASILESLMRSERVHPMNNNWNDLKQRVGGLNQDLPLDQNRRMYCFIHPMMQSEPVAFIQVSIMPFIPSGINQILTVARASEHTPNIYKPAGDPVIEEKCAIFYSISSTQSGLQGIELGSFLIKRVLLELLKEQPAIETFCTLSPIPQFAKWLQTKIELNLKCGERLDTNDYKFYDRELITSSEAERLLHFVNQELYLTQTNAHQALQHLLKLFCQSMVSPQSGSEMVSRVKLEQLLKPILMRLCARYLCKEKKRGKAFDPVTNFHVRNGANLFRLNWLGDCSARGMKQSYGIMVNYRYNLSDLEQNNQKYVLDGHIATGNPFQHMLSSF